VERVVISVGGSVLVPARDDVKYIDSLASLLLELSERFKLFVVVGGGKPARYYIDTGRALGASEATLDAFGIVLTRLNARLLLLALGPRAYPRVPKDQDEAVDAGKKHPIVVMGGVKPGTTTDGVAAVLAEKCGAARLVNATSVDGIYTVDPEKDESAKRIDRMKYRDLLKFTGEGHTIAGPRNVFDSQGARVMSRLNIPLYVVNGRDLEALRNAIEDLPFVGTRVV
jgi:uridylate kinase